MTTPKPPQPAFLTFPQQKIDAAPRVRDRTADFGAVVVYFSLSTTMHVHTAAQARELAAVFTRAAELLDAAEGSTP